MAAPDGSLTNAEYRKIHHAGQVPALKVDDEVITENPAILGYIASLAPERNLLGKTALEKARTAEWLAFLSNSLHGLGYGLLLRPGRFSDNEEHHPALQEKGLWHIQNYYAHIEKSLAKKPFPVGDAETVVDFYMLAFFRWAAIKGIDTTPYPNYHKLVKRIEAKESAQRVFKVQGLTQTA